MQFDKGVFCIWIQCCFVFKDCIRVLLHSLVTTTQLQAPPIVITSGNLKLLWYLVISRVHI